jgi:membrane protein implicated in regulation of membrane protease activity
MEFFAKLTGFEVALWFIAVPATIIFLLQTLMVFFGIDGHGGDIDHDFDHDISHDTGQKSTGHTFGWFSFKNLVNFFAVFAWTGISCMSSGMSQALALLIATFAGLSMVFIMTMLMRGMKKLSYDGSTKMSNAIGREATVYLTVPDNGRGKVSLILGGSLQYLDATSETGKIERGQTVIVTAIKGSDLVVKQK